MTPPTIPKSILKKTPYPATGSSQADRNREVALYHANLIQDRKDIELEILESTETLIDFPRAAEPYSASNPSFEDAKAFKNMLAPFMPSDYDALILERNLDKRCGYCLCSKPRVKSGGTAKFRILGMSGKAKDFKVVNKEDVEKWCSDSCAKRALYVRVQLSERPAWERGENVYGNKIDLLNEPQSGEDTVMAGIASLDLEERQGRQDEKLQDADDLAVERGDRGYAAKKGLVDVKIQEKAVGHNVQAPSLQGMDLSDRLDSLHLALEGHTSTFGTAGHRGHDADLWGEEDEI